MLATSPAPLRHRHRGPQIEEGRQNSSAAAHALITLGGDHTIACPLCGRTIGGHGPVALVHFDAHLDTWDTYFGAPLHPWHAVPPGRRGGAARAGRSAHVGIRGSLYSPDDLPDDAELGFTVVHCAEFDLVGPSRTSSTDAGTGSATTRSTVSIDIDVLDPALRPGYRYAGGRWA